MDIYEALDYGSLNLEHHGILGMRWGHRKQRIEERKAIFNRAKHRMALGFAAPGAMVSVPTVANAVYGRRLV